MGLPTSRNTTYLAGGTPAIKSFDLNDIQDKIVAQNTTLTGTITKNIYCGPGLWLPTNAVGTWTAVGDRWMGGAAGDYITCNVPIAKTPGTSITVNTVRFRTSLHNPGSAATILINRQKNLNNTSPIAYDTLISTTISGSGDHSDLFTVNATISDGESLYLEFLAANVNDLLYGAYVEYVVNLL